jgi:GNAT superfamily N-acetyltransferase
MDVELGIDYAKRNAKRIFEWLKQTHAVLGIIEYHRFDEIGKIDEFYVLDAYQHQGIGKWMFLKTLNHLKQLGVHVIILVANPKDEASTIYQKWGFSDITNIFQLTVHVKH